jgi:hypothetical protein
MQDDTGLSNAGYTALRSQDTAHLPAMILWKDFYGIIFAKLFP